jgi:hypothetical protein
MVSGAWDCWGSAGKAWAGRIWTALISAAGRASRNVLMNVIARKESVVAVFVIERRFAEAIDLSEEDVREINLINDEEDVRWLYSFLSVDRRKTYCLYEASSVEAVRRAAVRAGIPADVVIEVCGKVYSDGSLNPV